MAVIFYEVWYCQFLGSWMTMIYNIKRRFSVLVRILIKVLIRTSGIETTWAQCDCPNGHSPAQLALSVQRQQRVDFL